MGHGWEIECVVCKRERERERERERALERTCMKGKKKMVGTNIYLVFARMYVTYQKKCDFVVERKCGDGKTIFLYAKKI
jgi:hypothetical protein